MTYVLGDPVERMVTVLGRRAVDLNAHVIPITLETAVKNVSTCSR